MFYFCQKCELWLDLLYELNKATRLTSFEFNTRIKCFIFRKLPAQIKKLTNKLFEKNVTKLNIYFTLSLIKYKMNKS